MQILVVTPVPPESRQGNGVTARRWVSFLGDFGHEVTIASEYDGGECDLLVALHARRSRESYERFAKDHPDRPCVVALTGTDVYRDLERDPSLLEALSRVSALITLQPRASLMLPEALRSRVHVIYQSLERPRIEEAPPTDAFEVCVLGHLRPVKDPFRCARAARLLPAESRIRVLQVGAALDDPMATLAEEEVAANPRYRWVGELPRRDALRVLARSRLLVLTSELEGGANVVSEAVVLGVPVLSTRIEGSLGLLGEDYPGYFPVGDSTALASLLHRAETDPEFYDTLAAHCRCHEDLFRPERERESWSRLLESLKDDPS